MMEGYNKETMPLWTIIIHLRFKLYYLFTLVREGNQTSKYLPTRVSDI